MEFVKLGNTGLSVSRLGFGGIPIQRIDAEGTKKLFDALIEYNINYIDTSRGYTVIEEYIGYAIRGRRDKFVLATKSMAKTYEAMAKDIEISLTNLGTDYIDLYQVHNPNASQLETICAEGGALGALLKAKEDGKIGHIGITAHGLDVFEAALKLDWVETIMFPYNIVENQAEKLIEQCTECGKAFIAMKPLAGGAIENAEIAMRYIAANLNVTVAIPGMADIEELTCNVNAFTRKEALTEEENVQIAQVKQTLTGNFCRRCNYCAPCTVGINIPGVFLFAGYLKRYGLAEWAKDRYAALPVKAHECIGCGLCETRCPYGLNIRDMLKNCAEAFDK